MYDLIGDIHGHARELETLLIHLGYRRNSAGVFSHSERKAIFVGDLIDRGPQIRETLQIVKAMVDEGHALTVMGNHEYNAICYHTFDASGDPLRPHTERNLRQHGATLEAFLDHPGEWREYLEWMHTLPLWLEFEEFRVIHACWHPEWIQKAGDKLQGNVLSESFLHESASAGTEAHQALEVLLKGIEKDLPAGMSFQDKDNRLRTSARIQWWKSPHGLTLHDYTLGAELPKDPVPESFYDTFHYPSLGTKPVFIGHYWLHGKPTLQSPTVCCLDYSVAKGGHLVSYRWHGESALREEHLISVETWKRNALIIKVDDCIST